MEEHTCNSHGAVIAGIQHLGEILGTKIDALREDMTRRMDESAEDRRDLHAQHNQLAREVTMALTRLNGATLLKVSAHQRADDGEGESIHFRKSDTLSGWVRENWLIITAITAAAFAGEKVIPTILGWIGKALGVGP